MSRYYLICPSCKCEDIEKDEDKIEETGEDYFVCSDCGEEITLSCAEYTS